MKYLNKRLTKRRAVKREDWTYYIEMMREVIRIEKNGLLVEPGHKRIDKYQALDEAREEINRLKQNPPKDEETIQRLMDACRDIIRREVEPSPEATILRNSKSL